LQVTHRLYPRGLELSNVHDAENSDVLIKHFYTGLCFLACSSCMLSQNCASAVSTGIPIDRLHMTTSLAQASGRQCLSMLYRLVMLCTISINV
jgi:hypothetical protein